MGQQPPSGTVTFVFTDIVGSTALRDTFVAEHGPAEGDRRYREQYLNPHDERFRTSLAKHHGFEVKTIGDAFMIAFAQAEDAVLCSAEVQRSFRDDPIGIKVRIGMHTGPAEYRDHDYDGHTVNIAARVEGLLKGGDRIYCSAVTADLAKNTAGVRFHSHGSQPLKGVSDKVEIVEVVWDESIKPLPPAPQSLPYPWLTPWVGREEKMRELRESLKKNKLVTLHGPGGVGKTRLAVETLLTRAVVFVSLENATALLAPIRTALNITEADAFDATSLGRHLHDSILILDNFETIIEDAPEVAALAAIPGLRVLVTSQKVLGEPGECVIELSPMERTESERLFTSLAQQRVAHWQVTDVAALRDVLAATDGLPYLIEIVSTAITKRTLRQIANELKTRLTEVRARARKEQHESVQACLEWAFGRLPDAVQSAMCRLSLFASGFDAEAAKEVSDTPIESLDALVDASLLRFNQTTGRYTMLPTTQWFTSRRLNQDELARLRVVHGSWFIKRLGHEDDALRAKGADAQRDARRWLDAEIENVLQAIAWAEEKDVRQFRFAVSALGGYLRLVGRFSDDLQLKEKTLAGLDRELAAETWASAQANLGNAYYELPTGNRNANVRQAITRYEMALAVYNEHDHPGNWAALQHNLGDAYCALLEGDRVENSNKGIAFYEAALRVRTESGSPVEWATTIMNLGIAYGDYLSGDRSKNLTKAISFVEESLRVNTENDFPARWAMAQLNLGVASGRLGDYQRAIVHYQAALKVITVDHDPIAWALIQNNLGVACVSLEDEARGIEFYKAALRVQTEAEFPIHWAITNRNLARIYKKLSALESIATAIDCYEAAARGFAAAGLTEEADEARQNAEKLRK